MRVELLRAWPARHEAVVVELPEGRFAGHTFHYSKSETPLQPLARATSLSGRAGEAVYRHGGTTASYVHFYFPSNPAASAALFLP